MTAEGRPFEHLNLRRNPFGSLAPGFQARRRATGPVAEWASWLRTQGRMLEFVGPRGCGKSVRLRAVADTLRSTAEGGVVVVEVNAEASIEWPQADRVCIDEAQFVRTEEWRRLADRQFSSLAVATHSPLPRVARRFALTRRSVDCGEMTATRLADVIESRIRAVRRGEGELPQINQAAVEWLADTYDADLRGCLSHLYEVFQRLETPRPVTVDDLESVEPPEPDEIQPHPRAQSWSLLEWVKSLWS